MSDETGEPKQNPRVPVDEGALADLVRAARKRKGWTLEETGKRAGIGRSTLSKIENNQTKPGFDIVRRLTKALDLETPQLFLQTGSGNVTGRRDLTRQGDGELRSTPTYDHELLCQDLSSKRMLPYISQIKARNISEFPEWIRHRGEEFLFVLEGELELHTEHYRPLKLRQGDSVYYDSGMGHCCISTSEQDAKVLWVSVEQ